MPIIDFGHNFLNGLSDFWQKFFQEADQLDALYRGSAILVGQAYLDLLGNVLNVSLRDAPVFNKEYFKLVTIREDQIRYSQGTWVYDITDGLVSFASLDNKVIEPTVSLENNIDYAIDGTEVAFALDPTDPLGTGVPTAGYARRGIDAAVGGSFDDTARPVATTWADLGVLKGDTLRILDVGPVVTNQKKRTDHKIVLVRAKALYVSTTTPLTASADPQNFVVLRVPTSPDVTLEALSFSGDTATLAHTRLVEGSVRVYAKTLSGEDVVEGEDYTIDYEGGKVIKLQPWAGVSANKINYSWMQEVITLTSTGSILSGATTARVIQMALWAPDAMVDRRNLANNFGSLIGIEADSSENYRAFLRGIFQLYLLGPVFERIESALNVILGLPVVRDDGETVVSIDTLSDATTNYVYTYRASTNQTVPYAFPKATPLRTDLVAGLELLSFEPLTTAITVTDYVQDPNWWHRTIIPTQLFPAEGDGTVPAAARRSVSAIYVENLIGASDLPRVGDPGLLFGADENGFSPAPGHPVFRHRLAFVLMDRYLKYHTFFVRFDPALFSTDSGAQFARNFSDLNALIFSAKPSHTYLMVSPATGFEETVYAYDDGVYQPQTYLGADPDAPEIYATVGDLPDGGQPYAVLGLFITPTLGSPADQADQVLFTDDPITFGDGWVLGDYGFYEEFTDTLSFPTTSAVTVNSAPGAPRTRRLVTVYIDTTIGGKRLVENVDYTVDATGGTISRITVWDDLTNVSVKIVQFNVGNTVDAAADTDLGDTELLVGSPDPGRRTADFTGEVDWMGNPIDPDDARDLGMVERLLVVKTAPA
jgi:hypothetical protein